MSQEEEHDGSARRLREMTSAIEALSESFALFDEEDRLVLCNARFRNAHGPIGDMLERGLPWSIFVSQSARLGRGRALERIEAHLASGQQTPVAVEVDLPGDRWVRLGMHPTAEGGFVLTETDVTQAHAAAELRGEADDLMREVLDACSANVLMTRINDGRIIYQTPASKGLFGPAKSAKSFYRDASSRADFLADLLPTGAVDDFETTLLRADGAAFPAIVASRLVDYKGEEVMVSSIQDMTQLYGQRDEIVRINRRLFDAIAALDQGFALFDADHKLVLANQHYLDVNTALADIVVPGTANAAIVAAAEARGIPAHAAGLPEGESGFATEQFEFEAPDDRIFSGSRRQTSDGGFVLAWRDVTERRAAERELSRRREASLQNEKLAALGGLLAGVSHELNNPLSVILGQALMLREEVEETGVARRIERISNSAERCAKIVKTFLAMARQKPLKLAPVSITEIIETALDVASYGLRGVGATVETCFGADVPDVMADEDQIAQVFVNLIVNAEHALQDRGDRGRLVISTHADHQQGHVIAAVADNGAGVPENLKGRIFEPFFTTKTVGDGTGVGLALCHRIVDSHAGSISIGDAPDGGAVFRISLPAVIDNAAAPDRPRTGKNAAGLTALLVEDEEHVAEIIAELLSMFALAPTVVHSVEEALALLESNTHFDIVLSDIRMPGRGGRELFEEIEQRWPLLVSRVAFITGDVMSFDASAVVASSGRPLLEKPIAPNDLRALIDRLVETDR